MVVRSRHSHHSMESGINVEVKTLHARQRKEARGLYCPGRDKRPKPGSPGLQNPSGGEGAARKASESGSGPGVIRTCDEDEVRYWASSRELN